MKGIIISILLISINHICVGLSTIENEQIRKFEKLHGERLISIYLIEDELLIIHSPIGENRGKIFQNKFVKEQIEVLSNGILQNAQEALELLSNDANKLQISPQGNIFVNYQITISGVQKQKNILFGLNEVHKIDYQRLILENAELKKQLDFLKQKIEQTSRQEYVRLETIKMDSQSNGEELLKQQSDTIPQSNLTEGYNQFFTLIRQKCADFIGNVSAKTSQLKRQFYDNQDFKTKFHTLKTQTQSFIKESGQNLAQKSKKWTKQAAIFIKESGKKTQKSLYKIKQWFTD